MSTFRISQKLLAMMVAAGVLGSPVSAGAMELNTHSERLSLAPRKGATQDDRLRAAILSVHAYVEKNRENPPLKDILDHVDPLSPPEAAAILKKDTSPQGELRRRRALLRFLTWTPDKPEVKRAVEILVGCPETAQQIYRKLRRVQHPDSCQPSDFQDTVNDVLNDTLGVVAFNSCTEIPTTLATVVEKGGNIGISSKVTAKGPLAAAQKGLDAQRWDVCSPLWADTYLVQVDGSGNIQDNGSCSPANNPNCMPAEGAPFLPYGASYDTVLLNPVRPFFEHFVCDTIACDVRLLLHITTTAAPAVPPTPLPNPPPPAYVLTYDTPKKWKKFPFPDVDQGDVSVQAEDFAGGGSNKLLTVSSDKTFGFEDWGTTFAVYFMLRRIEMAQYLADLVCCDESLN